jgi:hypothetical protein
MRSDVVVITSIGSPDSTQMRLCVPKIRFVIAFVREEDGELVAESPIEMPSAIAATSRARSLSATKAGAIAFSRTGDPMLREFADATVLFTAGEVPDNVFDRE